MEVELSLQLISGALIDSVRVEQTCTGEDLKRHARTFLGPRQPICNLLVGANCFLSTDTVAGMRLNHGDFVTVVIGSYHERVQVVSASPKSRRVAWSYANDASGSMFPGCGDDFKLVAALSDIDNNAVSFEARGKPSHYVMLRDKALALVQVTDEHSDDENYASTVSACSFRLVFKSESKSVCCIEPCTTPLTQICNGRRGLGILDAAQIPCDLSATDCSLWKIIDSNTGSALANLP